MWQRCTNHSTAVTVMERLGKPINSIDLLLLVDGVFPPTKPKARSPVERRCDGLTTCPEDIEAPMLGLIESA
jgi:hypothetical protein